MKKLAMVRYLGTIAATLCIGTLGVLSGCAAEVDEPVDESLIEEIGNEDHLSPQKAQIMCGGTIIVRDSYCYCGHDYGNCHGPAYYCVPH